MPPLPRPSDTPVKLTLGRWLHLYLPLSLTFLLMSGSSPVVNLGIGHLPGETIGFAAFANAFGICLFLYSPCFAVRDIAQKYVRGRTSYRRVFVFLFGIAAACTGLLVLLGLTPLLDRLILRGAMDLPDSLVGPVKRAVLAFLPMPALITVRGIHQAVHITNETPYWIGIGTAGRFLMMILFVFAVAVPLRLEGGVLGGLAFAIGIGTEALVNAVTARRFARFLRSDPPGAPPPDYATLRAFAGPLFLANAMGVFLQPLTMRIVNGALLAETSAAAFGILKSFTWFFSSTLFAMQAMALAKADSVRNLRRLAAFELIPVSLFTSLFLVVVLLSPIRGWVLYRFFEIDSETTAGFVTAALPIALGLPVIMAARSTARGLLIRSGRTRLVTLANLGALLLLVGLNLLRPAAGVENGATVGYLCWMGSWTVELLVLFGGVAAIGVRACVTEGGAEPRLREEEVEGEGVA